MPKTPEEQAFWDAAFIAYVSGIVSDPQVDGLDEYQIARCASKADLMLAERRKRTDPNASP